MTRFLPRLSLAWRFWRDRKLHYSWHTAWILSATRSPWLT